MTPRQVVLKQASLIVGCDPDELSAASKLSEINFDSLDALDLIQRIEDKADIDIDDHEIRSFGDATLEQIIRLVDSKIETIAVP